MKKHKKTTVASVLILYLLFDCKKKSTQIALNTYKKVLTSQQKGNKFENKMFIKQIALKALHNACIII